MVKLNGEVAACYFCDFCCSTNSPVDPWQQWLHSLEVKCLYRPKELKNSLSLSYLKIKIQIPKHWEQLINVNSTLKQTAHKLSLFLPENTYLCNYPHESLNWYFKQFVNLWGSFQFNQIKSIQRFLNPLLVSEMFLKHLLALVTCYFSALRRY